MSHEQLRKLFGLVLLSNLIISLALYLLAWPISAYFREQRVIVLVHALTLQFLITPFMIIPQALMEREMDFKTKSIVDALSSLSGGMANLVLAYLGYGVWSLIIGHLAIIAVRTLGLNVARPWIHVPDFDFRGIGKHAAFGIKVMITRILWFLFSRIDVFIIGRLLGKDSLGIYNVAMSLSTLPMQKVNSVTNQVAFPAFSRIQEDRDRVLSYMEKAAAISAFVGFPVFFGISSIAPEIVTVVLGAKWQDTVYPIAVLSLIVPLRLVASIYPNVLQAMDLAEVQIANMGISILMLSIALVAGSRYGIEGIADAWLAAYILIFVIITYRTYRHLGASPVSLYRSIALPALASAGMYVVVAFSRSALPPHIGGIWQMALLVGAGAACYALLSYCCMRKYVSLIYSFART